MPQKTGSPALLKITPIAKPKKVCRECRKPFQEQLTLQSRTCTTCLRAKQKEKRKESLIRIAERKKKKKEKKANRPAALKKQLDALVSELVRRKGADSRGGVNCVSCGVYISRWQEAQNGHYVSRSHYSVRWDLRNCNIQCLRCNVFLKGNMPLYTRYLIENYGADWLQNLIADGEKIKKWTVQEMLELKEFFKNKLKEL